MEHQNKLIYGGILAISALTGCTEPVTEKPLNIVYKSNLSKIVYIMI